MTLLDTTQLRDHPEFDHLYWDLPPQQEGVFISPAGRSQTKIAYQVHGTGPTKLLLIGGLGSVMRAWQRQTKDFGHTMGDKYSVLVFDNRGLGLSDRPLWWYSTSIMAEDTIGLLDHVGWTGSRQVNVVGSSMGGMIAQEVAYRIPDRLNSVTFLSTACKVWSTEGLIHNGYHRLKSILAPGGTEDDRIAEVIRNIYTHDWLDRPDDLRPDEGAAIRECMVESFPTNGDRVTAQEVKKRMAGTQFTKAGYVLQMKAAANHNKTAEQLAEIGDRVGRNRIQVIHGTADHMLTFSHGVYLARGLGLIRKLDPARPWDAAVEEADEPAAAGRAGKPWSNWEVLPLEGGDGQEQHQVRFVDGQAHMMPVELRGQFRDWVEQAVAAGERENEKAKGAENGTEEQEEDRSGGATLMEVSANIAVQGAPSALAKA